MNVLSVGAGFEQLPSIFLAKKLGLSVISLDAKKDAIGGKESDMFYNVDIKDESSVIKIAKKHDIQFILPAPIGRYLTTVGAVNDALNLTGISKKSATYCADKSLFFHALKNTTNLAQQFPVCNADDVLHIIKNKIKPPFILKPKQGSGSQKVTVFHDDNKENIISYFQDIQNQKNDDIILEEFLHGNEIGVDAIVRNQKLEIIALRDKTLTPFPFRQEIRYTMPSVYQKKSNEIQSILNKVVQKLSIDNSLINADIMIGQDDIYLIELSARASGNSISHIILPQALNFNPLTCFTRFLMSEIETIPKKTKPLIFEYFNFPNNLVGQTISKIQSFDNIKTLVHCQNNLKVGDKIQQIKDGVSAAKNGFFVLQGPEKEMLADLTRIYQNFTFQ